LPHTFGITNIEMEKRARLGICPLPGRSGTIDTDLAAIVEWAPDLVVSLTEQPEMDAARAGTLGTLLADRTISWQHMPVVDFGVPEMKDNPSWDRLVAQIVSILDAGGRVLVHCKGGRGRSGMVLLRVMIERGEDPEDALRRLRAARPGAVETEEQFAWAAQTKGP